MILTAMLERWGEKVGLPKMMPCFLPTGTGGPGLDQAAFKLASCRVVVTCLCWHENRIQLV